METGKNNCKNAYWRLWTDCRFFCAFIERYLLRRSKDDKRDRFHFRKNYNDLTGKVNAKGVTEISICETEEGTEVELILDPFVYRYDFKVTGTIAGTEVSFTRADVDKVWIKDMDQFVAYEENGVHYRMYEPECMGKRPLVLFLHGGGECGEDNELQLTGTLGALRLAERWSDMYIMAPQAPSGNLGMQEMFEVMKKEETHSVQIWESHRFL